jgi:(1->4)-alpha-D-glucan 1-alpha-D-glucosylmutase
MAEESLEIDRLLRDAIERIQSQRVLPASTYRLQFHAGFKFSDATAIIPYLSKLGVTHVYASPYLKAKPRSMHGYDVIDHCRLNPELGSEKDYEAFVAALREEGMGHIFDMVPNHVGVGTNENVWWNDVLENGPASIYGAYFDINWNGSPLTDLNGRVLMPLLGEMYGQELESGKLKLSFEGGGFVVSYYERRVPISPRTYPLIFANDSEAGISVVEELRSLIAECDRLPDRCEGAEVAIERHRAKEEIKRRLGELAQRDVGVRNLIERNLKSINGVSGQPASFDRLDHLLRHQCFRLASWRTAPDEINYRRFFDVNDLAALAMEREEVFEATHNLVLNLAAENKIAGLRVDHPDGLYDPEIYFRRLQAYYVLAVAHAIARASPRFRESEWEKIKPILLGRLEREIPSAGEGVLRWPLYVLGEKILAVGEPLPRTWAVSGTTGYEFLNMTNGLFVDPSSAGEFDRVYHEWIEDETTFEDISYCKKKLILEISLASELNMLAMELKRIAERSRHGVDYSLRGLREALREVIACFPVYRSYISDRGASEGDRHYIQKAIDAAIRRNPKMEASVFGFIREVLLVESDGGLRGDEIKSRRRFAGKFQQVSAPVMAKGIEDTAFYIYNRLLSLNEVGGDPSRFGVEPGEVHAFFEERQRDWPCAMSTLSTHDTKRSEDVRARLNVLSEMPGEWRERLRRWGKLNEGHRAMIDGKPAPDRNEEYALYQTLLGAWPLNAGEMQSFRRRVHDSTLKAMRESKVYTSWTDPNEKREAAFHAFIDAIMDETRSREFLGEFLAFQRRISHLGLINSLSQTLIKQTAPGVPDTYQGTDLWDFSLVDPDNRRPVDFSIRARMLDEKVDARKLLDSADDGRIKLALHRIALQARKEYPTLFATGEYLSMRARGDKAAHVFAYARRDENRIAVVAAPRLIAGLLGEAGQWLGGEAIWGNTAIEILDIARGRAFRNLFTGARVEADRRLSWLASDVFGDFPVALLISE